MNTDNSKHFVELLIKNLSDKTFVRLALMNKRNKTNDLNTVTAKLIEIKNGEKLSFVYKYPTKDITKNYNFDESVTIVEQLLKKDFLQADLHTLEIDYFLTINKKNISSIRENQTEIKDTPQLSHDKEKN